MAIKDILAVVDAGSQDDQFVKDALALAEFHGASLTVLVTSALPMADYTLTVASPYVMLQDDTEAVEAKRARIGKLASGANVEVRAISDQPAMIFAKASIHARYADVVLFGPADSFEYPHIRRETMESILFSSGRPVLVIPTGHRPGTIQHLALGWNATREATLALRSAMEFAAPGAMIDVLVMDAKSSAEGHGSEPGADIARHLARHGFNATVVPVQSGNLPDAEALIKATRETGADFLSIGAYGHSRLRQMILGGVTRDLLSEAPIPLLFSH